MTAAVASQYLQFLCDFELESLKENLKVDSSSYISLLNSIARNAHHGLACAKASSLKPAQSSSGHD